VPPQSSDTILTDKTAASFNNLVGAPGEPGYGDAIELGLLVAVTLRDNHATTYLVQRQLQEILTVSRLAPIALFALFATTPVAAQNAPDLGGTWKGESEAIIWGKSSKHQPPAEPTDQARLINVPLTLTIDKQDGRRFSATLSSPRASELLVGIVSRTGTIFLADDDGTDYATLLGPDRIEICHLRSETETRHAACAELTRQP
jgi:hypothetical protein